MSSELPHSPERKKVASLTEFCEPWSPLAPNSTTSCLLLCVCFIFVHAAFVRIKLMTMMIVFIVFFVYHVLIILDLYLASWAAVRA